VSPSAHAAGFVPLFDAACLVVLLIRAGCGMWVGCHGRGLYRLMGKDVFRSTFSGWKPGWQVPGASEEVSEFFFFDVVIGEVLRDDWSSKPRLVIGKSARNFSLSGITNFFTNCLRVGFAS